MKDQLDRIEQKLDRLLSLMGSVHPPASSEDEFMTVLSTQGAEAAHKWQKDQMKRRRKSA